MTKYEGIDMKFTARITKINERTDGITEYQYDICGSIVNGETSKGKKFVVDLFDRMVERRSKEENIPFRIKRYLD